MAVSVQANPGDRGERSARTILSRGDAVERARSLAPGIAERVAETNELRRIPDKTISELHDSGLLSILTPRRFGGSELGSDALFAAAVEIARACGSSAWTFGVLAGHTALLTDFPEATQEEVLGAPDVVIASLLRLTSEPLEPTAEGYQLVKASGRFCSGVDHADWVIVRGTVAGDDAMRWFLLPRSTIEIVDDWYTVGLQGTGSKSLTVAPYVVPEAHSVPVESVRQPRSPSWGLPFSLCGASIGCAYAAVEAYRQMLAARGSAGESQASLVRLAKASADVDACYLMVLDAAHEHDDQPTPSPLHPGRLSRNVAYSVQQARTVVNELFAAAGGSALYSSAPMQRIWRDANAAAAHASFVWDNAATNFGRQLANQAM